MPAKYADYLDKARKSGEDTAFRHYWELCVILCLRDGLRSGDVFVPGSRRYADPATYLYTAEQWAPKRAEYCRLVGKPQGATDALEQGKQELHAALAELEQTLAGASPDDAGTVRLDEEVHLVVPPLSAEDIPAEAKALKEELAAMLPFAPIASLLIELDARTGFLNCFTHAGGLLRMAGSLKYGQATASLIVDKWSAASRQNTLAAALKEWGMLRRTVHLAKYLSDPAFRRKISRQLNKGESLHALRRDLHYAQQGTITRPPLEQQTEQAWCLTVLTNSVVAWTTEYYSRAVLELRSQGRDVPDEVLSHISPGHSDNINFFGVINVDVEAELAKLDTTGWRPLRAAQLRELGLTP